MYDSRVDQQFQGVEQTEGSRRIQEVKQTQPSLYVWQQGGSTDSGGGTGGSGRIQEKVTQTP